MKKLALILLCLIILTAYAGIAHAWCWDFDSDIPSGATTINLVDGLCGSDYAGICSGDVDWFRVYIPRDSFSYWARISTTGTTDTYGELYNLKYWICYNGKCYPILNLLGKDNNSGSGYNFQIDSYNLSSGNWYYIKVRHNSATGTGAYKLNVCFVPIPK